MTHQPVIDLALGKAIRCLRAKRGLTQEHLAFNANMTISALARIERGQSNPGWATIRQITDALHITLHQLIDGIEENEGSV